MNPVARARGSVVCACRAMPADRRSRCRRPSHTSTSGAGIRENSVMYSSVDSRAHHCQAMTSPDRPSMTISRHPPPFRYVPSAMTTCLAAASGSNTGRRPQHQEVLLRNARDPDGCGDGASSQPRNSASSARLRLDRSRAAPVVLQPGHIQRWRPSRSWPFFFILAPHNPHSGALFDRVLITP